MRLIPSMLRECRGGSGVSREGLLAIVEAAWQRVPTDGQPGEHA
jgi:hypothetical protein